MTADYNWLAVVAAAATSIVIGSLWYSPLLFAKAFTAAVGKSEEELKKGRKKSIGLTVPIALLSAIVLATLIGFTGAASAGDGAFIGFLLWLGVIAPVLTTTVLFEGRSTKLHYINLGFQLVSFVAQATLLAAWR